MIVPRCHSTECSRHYSTQRTHLIIRRKHSTPMQRTLTNNLNKKKKSNTLSCVSDF